MTWGLIEGFRNGQVQQGVAISTVNRRLATVKVYAQLAAKAGVIDPQELLLIQTVRGYSAKEGKRIDARRPVQRRGAKKAAPVSLASAQVEALKTQPDTPQGRRDRLLLCLLLDHGLRVGEVARLEVMQVNLQEGTLRFYRPKVDKEQTHQLSADTRAALAAWVESGDCPAMGPLLRGSRKGGALTGAGMSVRAMTARVRRLGEAMGLSGLSAHDCRHDWASYWAQRVHRLPKGMLTLQEAGGWNSLAMPRRYTEWAAIANEGMG